MHDKSDHELAQILWDYNRFVQPIEASDIIVGLGSADARTADWCAQLYHDGYAPTILFSGARGRLTEGIFEKTEAQTFLERAVKLGVPEGVILCEDRSTNSGENILYIHAKLRELGIANHKMIIVQKPYMVRRAYATFMKQWPDKEKPHVIMSAIDLTMDEYTQDAYITFEDMLNIMVGDTQRIREYPKLGYQIEQVIPEGVWSAYEELVRRGYTKHLLTDV